MTKIRAISGKGLAALLCSVLLLSQPVLGSPGVSISTPISSGDLRPDAGTPSSSEASSTASQSIAVAKLTGAADRNGQPLLNGSIVSSGDSLSTHEDSALLLASTPQERLWLGPNTSAKLTKDGGNLAISLGARNPRFPILGAYRSDLFEARWRGVEDETRRSGSWPTQLAQKSGSTGATAGGFLGTYAR